LEKSQPSILRWRLIAFVLLKEPLLLGRRVCYLPSFKPSPLTFFYVGRSFLTPIESDSLGLNSSLELPERRLYCGLRSLSVLSAHDLVVEEVSPLSPIPLLPVVVPLFLFSKNPKSTRVVLSVISLLMQ